MNTVRLLPLLAPLVAGCADYNMSNVKTEGASDTGDPSDAGDTAVDSDTGVGLRTFPAWFVIRADLAVEDGLPSGEGASVTIDVVDADLIRTDCVVPLVPEGITAMDAPNGDDGSLWWQIPVTPADEACADLPPTLRVGVGAMHPDVRARLGSVGQDAVAESLYAAYMVYAGDVAAFGYAGTAADLLGDDVAALPVPDGLYRLAPLYLVPLPE
ncbi:MAG: hypothetical protein ACK4YP_08690 [Myxococcota bacterium]